MLKKILEVFYLFILYLYFIFVFYIFGIFMFFRCLQLKAAWSTQAARVIIPMCLAYLHYLQLSAAPGVKAAPS